MKIFSRTLLAAVAFSLAAGTAAQAQPRGHDWGRDHHYSRPAKPNFQAPNRHRPPMQHWKKGQRVSDWKRRTVVRDWHRHGLKRPARGQEWVKVDNDYLLISVATGIIAGIIAGR